jgi:ABC-type transport system substrate-binding protein
MNLAVPPFDDLAVRKAVNYVLDKAAIGLALGGPFEGRAATHIAFDSLEQNTLVSYDPYHTPNNQGDLTLAKQQMMQSKYDRNRDGICDATVCRHILGLTGAGIPTIPAAAAVIARDLRAIGLEVDVVRLTADKLFSRIFDPRTRTPLALTLGIGGSLTAPSFFEPLLTRSGIGNFNHALIGATAAQLRGWGYAITSVPSVEDRVGQCDSLIGAAAAHCWASLDQYLMEKVVPFAPFSFGTDLTIVSPRVVAFSFDQFADLPALDRIAVKPET